MSTVDPLTGLTLLYVNDDNKVTCNLQCDDPEFLNSLVRRRVSLAEFHDALAGHLITHHPTVGVELGLAIDRLVDDRGQNPEQQPQGDEVDATRHTSGGEEEAQGSRDQQNQDDERHVDPLSLRGRF